MSVVDMARRIKVVHPDYLIMYKLGTFYKAFGKDAYILSSIFGYKYSIIDENIPICGKIWQNPWQFKKNSVNYIRITDMVYTIFWKKWNKLEEKIEISILLNLYGNLLTDTQKNYMDLYYNQDYSLSEIGDNENITRQAVRTILVKSKRKLYEYEQKLKFMEKENNIKKLIEKLQNSKNNSEKQKNLKKIQENLDY